MNTFSDTRIMHEPAVSGGPAGGDAVSMPLLPHSLVRSGEVSLFGKVCSFPVMLASFLVGMVFVWSRLFNVDPDLWWHIKVGDAILKTHHWPTQDIYSFTVNGQPWLAYEWLGDVLLSAAHRLAGLPGLVFISVLIGSGVLFLIYACATARAGSSKAGFVAAALLSVFVVMSFSSRPQMLGYLFLAFTVFALERFRSHKPHALWIFPLMMLLWVNTHGSWIIGMGALFVYWISGLFEFQSGSLETKRWNFRERLQLAGIFLLSLLALPITPYGVRVAASPFEYAFSLPLNVSSIEEWQAMPFHEIVGKAFLALLLILIVAQIALNLRWRLEELILFLFGTALACLHVRFLLVFVPFAAPVVARIIARWMPPYESAKDKYILNAALMLLVLFVVVRFFPTESELQRKVAKTFPVDAVNYLAAHAVPEPIFNNYAFGGYLIWARGPQHKLFVDGRGDVYERGGVFADYLHISRLKPGALAVLKGYGVHSCLLQRDEPLSNVLAASPDWRRVYVDDVSAIFVRTRP